MKPFAGTSYSYIATAAVLANQTKVTWVFSGMKNYMMKVFHLLLNLEKVLGKDLQTSLDNLKIVLEK